MTTTQTETKGRAPKPPKTTAQLVTLAQAEMIKGIPQNSLRDLIARGVLPIVRFVGSRRIWIDRRDLDALIERSKERVA